MWLIKLKNNIYNFSIDELKSYFLNIDEKTFRAEQIWNWLYVKGISNLKEINNISNNLLRKIIYKYEIPKLKVKKYLHSKDGTKKWLLSLGDGKEIETVYIPEKNRGTVCVSSQVGCTLSCSFCHTGTMKYLRNLAMSEIIGQIIFVKNELDDFLSKLNKN